MENKTINTQEKFKNLHFNKEIITLLLDIKVNSSSFNKIKKEAEENNLSQKTEFHITLIGSDTGERIKEKINSSEQEKIISAVEKLSQEFNWNYSQKEEYYFVSKIYPENDNEERKSIIEIIDLPDIVPFYHKLNELLGTNFDVPIPHITLSTTSTREEKRLRGIGIYSNEQFTSLNPRKIETI